MGNEKSVCSKCGKEGEKYRTGKRDDTYCKECRCRYEWERSVLKKIKAVEYKGGKCSVCGYDRYYGALAFHHTDPSQKEFNWSILRLHTWEAIFKELDKCILVCHNCHAELHAKPINEFLFEHESMNTIKQESEENRKTKCVQCHKEFVAPKWNSQQKFCSVSCQRETTRKVKNRPGSDELKMMIETMPMTHIGNKYGVTDNAVRRWAREYKIPLENRQGYWAKQKSLAKINSTEPK